MKETILIVTVVFGSFIGAWAWALSIDTPWPIVGWFLVALMVVGAGSSSDDLD